MADFGGDNTESFGAGPPSPSSFGVGGASSIIHRRDRQSFLWSKVNLSDESILPPPRSGAASVVVQGKLYMFGGYGGGFGRLDDFYSFDFATSTWEEVQVSSNEKPGCRENNGVVISDSSKSIYLFGGYNGSSWLNDLWKFDIESKRWTCIQESSDHSDNNNNNNNNHSSQNNNNMTTRTATASVGGGGGGDHDADMAGELNVLQNGFGFLSIGVGVRGKVPSRRFGYVSVVHNNKLVLFGGFDGARWLNDMYVFDFNQRTWHEVQAGGTLPSVRSCPAWTSDETHVYIQGGYDGVERKDDFFACDLSTYTWTQMPSLGVTPSPRYFHSCCLYGNKMYLYGGYSGSQRLADMFVYDFDTNHWSEVMSTNTDAPSGRSSLVAQVYENNLYVFGGYNGSTVLNDFYRFRLRPIGVPAPGLIKDFGRLVNQPDMSDVCFLVESQEVYAHRAILAVRSEYFRALLFNGLMRESVVQGQPTAAGPLGDNSNSTTPTTSSNNNTNAPIELVDVSHKVFLKVLEYLYTDTVRGVNLELGIHLLIASELFMLDRLKALCEDIIRREINTDTAIGILITSHQHNALGLKEIALDFILRNLAERTIQAGLSDLKEEPDLLVEIIKLSSSAQQYPSLRSPPTVQQPRPGMGNRDISMRSSVTGPFGVGAEWDARR